MTEADVRRAVERLKGRPEAQVLAGLREVVRGRAWAHADYRGPAPLTVEQKLLAALLWIPSQVAEVREELPAEAFEGETEREVYSALLVGIVGDAIDSVTFGMELKTPEARALARRLWRHPDAIADDALRYARQIAASWGDRP